MTPPRGEERVLPFDSLADRGQSLAEMGSSSSHPKKIFISYRREDSGDATGRIYDRLVDAFGEGAAFLDVDSVPLGVDFRAHIRICIEQCSVMLVMIGDHWLQRNEAGTSRIDNPQDYVRLEIETGLAEGLRVIPVLVGDAGIPASEALPESIRDLSFRNAVEVRAGRHFAAQLERLLEELRALLGTGPHEGPSRGTAVGNAEATTTGPDAAYWDIPRTSKSLITNPDQLLRTVVGPFRILYFVGSGGTGIVFKAIHQRSGVVVALKLSYPIHRDIESLLGAVARSARGISAIDHPNIPKIIDFERARFADAPSIGIAASYVDGKCLDVWSREIDRDSSADIRRLGVAVLIAQAMQAAHEAVYFDATGFQVRGVVHGDIKPANILVTKADQPFVTDFMLADLTRPLAERVYDTSAFGTAVFAAPEQLAEGIVSERVDIHAFGVALACLFSPSTAPPFAVSAVSECFDRATAPVACRNLAHLFEAMTARDPQSRPASMRVVAESLGEIRATWGGRPSTLS